MAKPETKPVFVLALYTAIAVLMTWPLAPGLARDVPGDLGDALLNMWILDWMARGIPRVATGAMALSDLWNANIFHPEPLALAFSEHLFGETLQMLPAYALTNNIILGYNLVFLASFVLAGFGMYLLALDLTGRRDAAFIAGVMFAFTPLRIAQLAHIQIVSTQWMPFTLYGFRRYVASGRWTALAGGTAAFLMLAWSCGYYLIYFSPFVPLFILHQLWVEGRLSDPRRWVGLSAAALVVAAGVAPFVSLYTQAQRVHDFERPLGEVVRFSTDLGGYFTVSEMVRSWGSVMRVMPKPEGEVFPGLLMLGLAATAVGALLLNARRESADTPAPSGWRRAAAALVSIAAIAQSIGLLAVLATGGFIVSIAGIPVRATGAGRIVWSLVAALALLLILSPRARRTVLTFARSWIAVAAFASVIAIWLSLGPLPTSLGRAIEGVGFYRWLFEHIPGFDGLRVPARYAMVAACFLSMLAAAGAALVLRAVTRPAIVAAALSAIVLVEGSAVPIPLNATWGDGAVIPPDRVHPAADAPAMVQKLAALPPGRVVAEFPFGDPAWELRYVYYASAHHQRIVNGYSGGFPRGYLTRVAALQRIGEDPDRAWQALVDAGTTHVVLHRDAWTPEEADATAAWLTAHGARLVDTSDRDELYEVR